MSNILLFKILVAVLAIASIAGAVYYRFEKDQSQYARPMNAKQQRALHGLDNAAKDLQSYHPK